MRYDVDVWMSKSGEGCAIIALNTGGDEYHWKMCHEDMAKYEDSDEDSGIVKDVGNDGVNWRCSAQ